MSTQEHQLTVIRDRPGTPQAVLFFHGFSGKRNETWGLFPYLIGTHDPDWDLFSLGYHTSLLPDIRGIWTADPDLPTLALHTHTRLALDPLAGYKRFALVAHSMGGLVVQRTLADHPALAERVSHVILFGTPSAGLVKAWLFRFWSAQLNNMARDGAFIASLRRDWEDRYGKNRPFELLVVAGDQDQFVPPDSSLTPFEAACRRVVSGDHLSIVKPGDRDAESLKLVLSTLTGTPGVGQATRSPLRLAAELGREDVERLVEERQVRMTEAEVVQAVLALDRSGRREDAIAFARRYQDLGTDVQGTLAGRIKRRWLQDGRPEDADWAYALYVGALDKARHADDFSQAYYHAINVAFMDLVAFDRPEEAEKTARAAVQYCLDADDTGTWWNLATQGEAHLYLGNPAQAFDLYRQALLTQGVEPWKLLSTGVQAMQVAVKQDDPALQDELRALFDVVLH